MKRFLKLGLVIILILLSFKGKTLNATEVSFKWLKYDIYVPVGSDLESYKDDYLVKMYVNGKESSDFKVYYEVDDSFFTTVQVNKVGTYKVIYEAYSKTYLKKSKQVIYFHIYDNKAPELLTSKDLITINYQEKIDYLKYFTFRDNVSKMDKLTYKIDDSGVSYEVLGTYDVYLSAFDESLNENKVKFKVKIIDEVKPTIKLLKPLIFSYGKEINYEEFFEVKDNYDGNLLNYLEISNLDLKKIGKEEVLLKVEDSSHNETSLKVMVEVIDDEAPSFNLINLELPLNIEDFKNYNEAYFLTLVSDIKDNCDSLEDLKMEVDLSNLKEEVNDFIITYSLTDLSFNKASKELVLRLREVNPPEIFGNDLEIKKGMEVDLKSLVQVYDKYDSKAYLNLEVLDNNFNNLILGTYEITYRCYNNSGLYALKVLKIKVFEENEADKTLPPSEVHDIKEKKNYDVFGLGLSFLFGGILISYQVYQKYKRKKLEKKD